MLKFWYIYLFSKVYINYRQQSLHKFALHITFPCIHPPTGLLILCTHSYLNGSAFFQQQTFINNSLLFLKSLLYFFGEFKGRVLMEDLTTTEINNRRFAYFNIHRHHQGFYHCFEKQQRKVIIFWVKLTQVMVFKDFLCFGVLPRTQYNLTTNDTHPCYKWAKCLELSKTLGKPPKYIRSLNTKYKYSLKNNSVKSHENN